jgi:hypothetical protein
MGSLYDGGKYVCWLWQQIMVVEGDGEVRGEMVATHSEGVEINFSRSDQSTNNATCQFFSK